jgi:hypothetical protein
VANLLQRLFLLGVRHSRFVQDIKRNIDAAADGSRTVPRPGVAAP